MQSLNRAYINPYYNEILKWLNENKYELKGKNNIEEDWIFEKKND